MENTPRTNCPILRAGLACLAIAILCLVLLVLSAYPQRLAEDYFHARGWQDFYASTLDTIGMMFVLSTAFGYALVQSGRGKPVNPGLLLLIVITPFMLVVLSPFFMHRHHPAYAYECLNNQRQIATAIGMYSQENGNRLPQRWEDISQYVDARLLTCPSSKRYFHQPTGYGMNAHILGKPLAGFKEPSQLFMTADTLHLNAYINTEADIYKTRHTTAFVAGYLDGHVEIIKADEPFPLK